ncbi:NAD(P)-dependent oxidoreductase [Advenella sp. S44]|uniref:NAD(P)-dependent oxidoreductase n=2 Tax=unclassified Advenella TaxID=2685285 RepID=UPI0013747C32|nr:NAD(P)-dependent oxidoreductase [Advenella sp. S44]
MRQIDILERQEQKQREQQREHCAGTQLRDPIETSSAMATSYILGVANSTQNTQWCPKDPLDVQAISGGIHADKAFEYSLMALLMLATGMPNQMTNQRAHHWQRSLTPLASTKRVLVVGYGNLGRAVIRAAKVLGMQVSAINKRGASASAVDRLVGPSQMDAELKDCDILVLACPLTDETRHLIGERQFALLPRGAGLINIARGPIVDSVSLIKFLKAGHLGGAILDVFDIEPLTESSELWDAPNLVLTPHTSCDLPSGYVERSLGILLRNLERLENGERTFENQVSVTLGY